MLACLAPFLAGVCGLRFVADSQPYARLACLWVAFTYTATWTLSMAVATANVAGHTKKITTNALLLIGYCLGNFVGPFFFRSSSTQVPRYDLGVAMMFFCIAAQVVCLVALGVLFRVRNRRRCRSLGPDHPLGSTAQNGIAGHENEADQLDRLEDTLRDETDLENKLFKVG